MALFGVGPALLTSTARGVSAPPGAAGLLAGSVGCSSHQGYRAPVVGGLQAITRLIGAVLFERNDEWQRQHRYMQVDAFSRIDAAEIDPLLSITTRAA